MQPVSLFVVLIFVVKMLRAHHLESYNSFSHLSIGSSTFDLQLVFTGL